MTSYFAGGDRTWVDPVVCHRLATRLREKANSEGIGYAVLFSAINFVLRDGRAPKDSAVLQEARRRQAQLDRFRVTVTGEWAK